MMSNFIVKCMIIAIAIDIASVMCGEPYLHEYTLVPAGMYVIHEIELYTVSLVHSMFLVDLLM